ncbi:hypothetical protein AAG906_029654 [Vitis piasezkii]
MARGTPTLSPRRHKAPKPCVWKQATRPSHGHLDMARAHTSVWERHTDALDTWSAGWCMLPRSEGLDQRHAGEHPVTRGTLQGRRQLDIGDQVKQPIDLQLAGEMMVCASGWRVQATIWVVGGYARQLWAVLASCITTSWEGMLAKNGSSDRGSSSGPSLFKVRVLELKGFNDNRNTKELENFLWDMEQFFKVAHIPDGEKVSITAFTTWETLKKEFKDQFLPTNTTWEAGEALKRLDTPDL